jgi:hypothetical protein
VTVIPQVLQDKASSMSLQCSVYWRKCNEWPLKVYIKLTTHTTENGGPLWIKATQSIIYFT